MTYSLETRVPFLDNDLMDFALHMTIITKLGDLSEVVQINENELGAKLGLILRMPATASFCYAR